MLFVVLLEEEDEPHQRCYVLFIVPHSFNSWSIRYVQLPGLDFSNWSNRNPPTNLKTEIGKNQNRKGNEYYIYGELQVCVKEFLLYVLHVL